VQILSADKLQPYISPLQEKQIHDIDQVTVIRVVYQLKA